MRLEHHKTAVGAFILTAIALLIAGIIALGGNKYLAHDTEYVLYFNHSVAGLNIGSPVMLRGVPLGTVTRISLITTASNAGVITPVHVRITSDSLTQTSGDRVMDKTTEQEVIREMIRKGLRAQLSTASLLTGQTRILLDFYPDTEPNFQSPNPLLEIPTISSPIDDLQRSLRRLPIRRIVADLESTLTYLNNFVLSGQISDTFKAVETTFNSMNELLKGLDKTPALVERILTNAAISTEQAPQAMAEARKALQDLAAAAEQIRAAASSANRLTDVHSPLATQLGNLIRDGAAAARTLRNFAETLDRNPESILRGRQGAY